MNKAAIKYGLISGILQATLMATFSPIMLQNDSSLGSSQLVGYSSMVVALALIFFGIREQKIKHQGGTITFKKALETGALIALISAIIYTVAWMALSGMKPELNDRIADMYRNDLESKNLSPEELSIGLAEIESSMRNYENPFFKFSITMLEILPLGLFVSLLSAWILRTKLDD